MSEREPLKFYRLWCGGRRYSDWLPDKSTLFRIAYANGIGYPNLNGDGGGGLGPLAWIEVGSRKYARSRTVAEPSLRDPPWS